MNGFKNFDLDNQILSAISELGFETPTPIQEKVIPVLLENNRDIVGLAQTGTGKTAAFGLPVIQTVDGDKNTVQCLILSPTRELCIQIANDLKSYSKFIPHIGVAAVYGGANIETQIKELNSKPQIVVGTPGRSLDLIKRKRLKVSNIRTLVLDEADEMLSMGFKDELDKIMEATNDDKRTLLFSATMPDNIKRIASKFMVDPVTISTDVKNNSSENVQHLYYEVHAKDRYEALKRVSDVNPNIYGIIFCRTRRETKEIAEKLINDGYNADSLHGDLSQAQRDLVMSKFRNKNLQLLVATDVAARGLDVDNLTHVINYNLPDENEVYVHRSGRTGRAGKRGISLSIIHLREKHKIKSIEKITGKTFEKSKVPTGKEICTKQLFNLVDKMEKVEVDASQIEPFMDVIYKKLEWLSREELIKRFVSVEFNRFLDYYKNSKDINNYKAEPEKTKKSKKRAERAFPTNIKFARFFINAGSSTNLNPASLIGLINKHTKAEDMIIGQIEIMKNFSFFEADSSFTDLVLKSFKKAEYHKLPLTVELASPKNADAAKGSRSKRKKRKGRK